MKASILYVNIQFIVKTGFVTALMAFGKYLSITDIYRMVSPLIKRMREILLCFLVLMYSREMIIAQHRTTYFPQQEITPSAMPKKENLWIFILAGQSNMAGRGLVEPEDTICTSRILTFNESNRLILAKEPLHFYEPNMTGLDCGVSFARTLLAKVPDSVSILLIPTAVGGSAINQWLGDSIHTGVKLLTNLSEKLGLALHHGQLKGILWHQGESDANASHSIHYEDRLKQLFRILRQRANDHDLPIITGCLGSFAKHRKYWIKINKIIKRNARQDNHVEVIKTRDLDHKGDQVHFNTESQRKIGERMAIRYASHYL